MLARYVDRVQLSAALCRCQRTYEGESLTFEVRCGDIVLGHSELEHADKRMGMLSAPFRPAPGYEQFRPLFRRLATPAGRDPDKLAQLAQDIEELNRLEFRLFDPAGREVPAFIQVYDYSVEVGPEAYQLEVSLVGTD